MKMILTLLFLLAQVGTAPTAREAMDRIRAKTPVEAVSVTSAEQLAGRYSSASEEKRKRSGLPMGGFDLYLFSDMTYVFCNWTDVSPYMVFDKGSWKLKDGLITLARDPDLPWDPDKYYNFDMKYIAIQRVANKSEALLVGVDRKLPYFEEKAGQDPAWMLLVVALKREKAIEAGNSAKTKTNLMKKAWRPEFYRGASK